MGGYGALTIAFRHPNRFDFVASIAGAIMYPKDTELLDINPKYKFAVPSTNRAFGELPNSYRDDHDPFILYKNTLITDLPYIFMFVGLQDYFSEIVSAHKDLADSLNAYGAFFEYHELQGYHNSPTVDASLNILLNRIQYFKNKAYKSFISPLLQIVIERDVESAIIKYRELKTSKMSQYKWNPYELNSLGNQLLEKDMIKEAIEIFKLNIIEYPDVSNTYDSLAEAYMIDRNKELAIKYYRKSLELNPDNNNAKNMIEKLQSD
jgi:tetratricopeptide (TPR) repeat protein